MVAWRSVGAAVELLARAVGGSTGCAGVTERPSASGSAELPGQFRVSNDRSGSDYATEAASPGRRSDAVHAAAGRVAGAVVTLHGRGGRGGGDADREPATRRGRRADRLLRECPRVADRSQWRPNVPRVDEASEGGSPRSVPASG